MSFRTTAERLNISVSAVSHRIAALESEIGLRLFDRGGRRVKLTATGVAYRERLQPLISELMRLTQSVYNETESQALRIASFQLFETGWLGHHLGRFLDLYPKAEVELMTLRRRQAIHPDLTIRILRMGEEGADDELLKQWNLVPTCSQEFAESYRLKEPADLARVRLIYPANTPDAWPRWFATAGLSDARDYNWLKVDSPMLSLTLAREGVGVSLVSDWLLHEAGPKELIKPFSITCPYPSGLYINRIRSFERPIVRAFRDWLTSELGAAVELRST